MEILDLVVIPIHTMMSYFPLLLSLVVLHSHQFVRIRIIVIVVV